MSWIKHTGGTISFIAAGSSSIQAIPESNEKYVDTYILFLEYSGTYCIIKYDAALFQCTEKNIPLPTKENYFWCCFSTPKISDNICNPDEYSSWNSSGFILPAVGEINQIEKYQKLFKVLIDQSLLTHSTAEFHQEICNSYLRILLYSLADDLYPSITEYNEQKLKGESLTSRVKEWVLIHSSEDISVHDVAAEFNYNSDYLTQVFRRESGITLCAYINIVRIEKAKRLLLSTNKRVSDIGANVGFRDEKYFMRTFKKLVKITPTEFRTFNTLTPSST